MDARDLLAAVVAGGHVHWPRMPGKSIAAAWVIAALGLRSIPLRPEEPKP